MATETDYKNGSSKRGPRSKPGAGAAGQLSWKWIPGAAAANAALDEHAEMEALRKGQDLLTVEQFANALEEGSQEILMTSYGFALVLWGDTKAGKTMNILTVTTDMEHADIGIQEIEAAAYERGARCVVTAGRGGWEDFLIRHGYTVTRSILAKKVLDEHSIS